MLFGQFETAEVLGTVRDASGGTIVKASVTLTNLDTGIQAKATSDENGNYDFFNVKVGRYSLAVEQTGFSKFTTTDVQVNVNARQRVDVAMKVGAITESVEVTGAAAPLETDSSEHGQVINTAAIAELPLNGRNYADLALLSTNAVKSPISATFSPSGTPREGAFNINGMRSTYNSFLLDGLDNNAYGTSNQGYSAQLVQLSPDAIAEFKVIGSNYSAEYGRVGGAVVNAVMKSGGNDFHGSAYEFVRNTDFNATGFLFSPAVFVKPTLQRNQFGATLGGPFIKNKLFYFADYEGFRQLQRYLNFDSIPSMTDRAGILPVLVVDPLTGTVSGEYADSGGAVESVRRGGAGRAAADQWARTVERRRSAAADPRLRRQIRREDRRADQRPHVGVSSLQPAQGFAVLRAGPDGAFGRRRQRLHTYSRSERFGGVHLDGDGELAVRSAVGLLAYPGRERTAVCRGSEHVHHVRRFCRAADDAKPDGRDRHADDYRTYGAGAADQQSAVSKSDVMGPQAELLEDHGAALSEDGLRVSEGRYGDS
jgi:hypothetical protein